MSGLETNKIAAAILTAGVVAGTCGLVTKLIIHPATIAENAYPINVAEAASSGTEVAATAPVLDPIEPLMAAANMDAGIKVAKKCTACHTFEEGGANKIGPNLYDLLGRAVASVEGFSYSAALQEKAGETWSYDNLNAFLAKPKDWAPGTKMAFAGIKKAGDRANIVTYLRSLAGSPMPLPE